MPKGKTKSKIKPLKNKLWKLVSTYIRKRDKGVCITCGKAGLSGSGYHAGHFIPSSTCGLILRYHEFNIHGQCYHCNINLGGYGAMYYQKMVQKYGQKKVDDLFTLKNQSLTKWTEEDYEKLIEEYEEKLKKLK